MKGIYLTGGRFSHAGNHQPELTARDYRQQHDADKKDAGEVVNLQGIGAEMGGISPFSDRETKCGQPGTAGERLASGVFGRDDLLIRDAKADTEVYEAQPADNPIRPRDAGDQAGLLVAHRYGCCLMTADERGEADDPIAVIRV